MSLKYGRPTPPEDFMIGALIPLGLDVQPERDLLSGLPGYVVTVLPGGHDNRYVACPVVSVHSFGNTRDEADKAAWNAHDHLISLTPGDPITLATGVVVPGAWVCPKSLPAFANYGDPFIKRYVARYEPALRYH